jgi:hypothetical protein
MIPDENTIYETGRLAPWLSDADANDTLHCIFLSARRLEHSIPSTEIKIRFSKLLETIANHRNLDCKRGLH